MILIEYVKASGFILALILAIHKWRHAPCWMRVGPLCVGYAELAIGYFAGTLIGSLVLWPNMTTYALWFYCGMPIAIVSIYRMTRFEVYSHPLVWSINASIIAELFVILTSDELLWEWEWSDIAAGIVLSMLCCGLFAALKRTCGCRSNNARSASDPAPCENEFSDEEPDF